MPLFPRPTAAAAIFVAASNASQRSIQRADFVCSGSGDQTTIASAVAALPAGGGSILFSEGTFTTSSPYILVSSAINFGGMGTSTIFQSSVVNGCFVSLATAFSDIVFDNISFNGPVNQTVTVPTRARTTSGAGIDSAIRIDGSLDTTGSFPAISNIIVRNCIFRNTTWSPIRILGVSGKVQVVNNEFYNCQDVGFTFDQEVIFSNNDIRMSADNGVSISRLCLKVTCTGNTFENISYTGIWLSGFTGTKGPQEFSCTGNTIKNCGNSAILLYDAPKYGVVSGNYIEQGYNRGASDVPTDIDCSGISVRGFPSTTPASPTDYASGINIAGNTIKNASRSGVSLNGCKGVTVENNLVLDTGTQFYANGTTVIGTNLAGMANPQNIGIFLEQVATLTDVHIRNNTFLDQRATPYGITAIWPAPPISGVTTFGNVQNGMQLGPTLATAVRSDVLGTSSAGEETMPRWAATNLANLSGANQALRLSYFRARRNETVTQIRFSSGNTAAGATPTLIRFALYSVDSAGNLTLMSASTNDTTIFAAALTDYVKTMAASATLTEGQYYAIGVLVVTAAAVPTIIGVLGSTPANCANDPRLCSLLTAQADIPSSITFGSMVTTQSFCYAQVF